jgi:hypothetical protein
VRKSPIPELIPTNQENGAIHGAVHYLQNGGFPVADSLIELYGI